MKFWRSIRSYGFKRRAAQTGTASWCAIIALLLQLAVPQFHTMPAVAGGPDSFGLTTICTQDGVSTINADGTPADSHSDRHDQHDCCTGACHPLAALAAVQGDFVPTAWRERAEDLPQIPVSGAAGRRPFEPRAPPQHI